MISERCKGHNLLNHCKQVNKPSNLTIEYNMLNNKNIEWECVLSYDNNGEVVVNKSISISKLCALNDILKKIEYDLKGIVGCK